MPHDDPNWFLNRVPATPEEIDEALAELWTRLGHPSQATQMSLSSRLSLLTSVKFVRALDHAASQIDAGSGQLAKSLRNLQSALDERIKDYTAASDRTAAALVKWTRWLAVATVVLAVFTAVLAIEAGHRFGHTFGWW